MFDDGSDNVWRALEIGRDGAPLMPPTATTSFGFGVAAASDWRLQFAIDYWPYAACVCALVAAWAVTVLLTAFFASRKTACQGAMNKNRYQGQKLKKTATGGAEMRGSNSKGEIGVAGIAYVAIDKDAGRFEAAAAVAVAILGYNKWSTLIHMAFFVFAASLVLHAAPIGLLLRLAVVTLLLAVEIHSIRQSYVCRSLQKW